MLNPRAYVRPKRVELLLFKTREIGTSSMERKAERNGADWETCDTVNLISGFATDLIPMLSLFHFSMFKPVQCSEITQFT